MEKIKMKTKENKLANFLGRLIGNFISACAMAALIEYLRPVGFWHLVLVLQLIPWTIMLTVFLIVGLIAVLTVD
jgi:hypothetical protein